MVAKLKMTDRTFMSVSTEMQAVIYAPDTDVDDGRVILYLHGSGGFGSGIEGLYEFREMPSLLKGGLQLTSTVLIPSCHIGESWQPLTLSRFLDDFERGSSRPNLQYDLLGYSRGGLGAFSFAAAYPARARSIAVVSTRPALTLVSRIAGIPVLICHGVHDQRTPASEAHLMHEELRAAGCKCRIMLVEGDHFIIGDVLSGGAVFEWQRNAAQLPDAADSL